MELKIDHEFETMIPPLTKEEFKELEDLIVHDRIIYSPILSWRGVIIDGHNRYRIAKAHPEVHFNTRFIEFKDREEAIAWICKNQLGRRNLTPAQKKYLIGKQYETEKARHGGNRKSCNVKSSSQNGDLIERRKTCDRIARENGVGKNTVIRSGAYARGLDAAEEAVPGIRQMVFTGEIRPSEKEVTAVAEAPEKDRSVLAENLKKPHRRSVRSSRSRTDLKEIRAIAEAMDSNSGRTRPVIDTDFVITELQNALESMEFRWKTCINDDKSVAMKEDCREKIRSLVREGIRFLQEYE